MTWSPNKPDYDRRGRGPHSMLLQCLVWRKRNRNDHTIPYTDALAKTASASIEAIVRKRRILIAASSQHERGPQRAMFEELVWSKGYSGGQEKNYMVHPKKDMSVFGMEFEGWRKATQTAG